jgi:hypothetical protein
MKRFSRSLHSNCSRCSCLRLRLPSGSLKKCEPVKVCRRLSFLVCGAPLPGVVDVLTSPPLQLWVLSSFAGTVAGSSTMSLHSSARLQSDILLDSYTIVSFLLRPTSLSEHPSVTGFIVHHCPCFVPDNHVPCGVQVQHGRSTVLGQ